MPGVGIVPAAGRAERFGRQKLVELVGGEPLLNRTLRALLDAGVDGVVVVTAPDEPLEAVTLLRDARVSRVVNPDPSRGMFSSIQTGVAAAPMGDPLIVLPGDMPFIQAATVVAVVARAPGPGAVAIARCGDKRGHPLALPRSLGSEILKADPRGTLSDLLTRLHIDRIYVDVADRGVVRDVDVPGDLA